jgi:hypothetical protein
VAERLRFDSEESLTPGKAVVGLRASKSLKFGIYEPPPPPIRGPRRLAREDERLQLNILNRSLE